jgi:NAD(P) transhydrogenase subunit alpha
MRPGAIIIDLAGPSGGNCALSRPGEEWVARGVRIMCPLNLPATIPVHASQLYSRNVTAFLSPLIKDGQLVIDMADDVVGPSCVTHNGEFVNQRVAAALGAGAGS